MNMQLANALVISQFVARNACATEVCDMVDLTPA